MQVCTTWRAVSHSDPLWHRLTSVIWGRTHRMHATWHQEYIFQHRTAQNFRGGNSVHHTLHFVPSDEDIPDGLICRCLTLSDTHLACGFANGTVRLFDLVTHENVNTFRLPPGEQFGHFSRAVSGIVISDLRIIFATLDGDIHVVEDGGPVTRRAHGGNVLVDGALVDFTGCGRLWVGLYAGVPGRAFNVWDGITEELLYVITSNLTDPEAVMGWHTLAELTETLGRVRMTSQDLAVACTSLRYMVLDLRNRDFPIILHDRRREIIVTSFDTNNEAFMIMNNRGLAIVRQAESLEDVCQFGFNIGQQRNAGVMGCMNSGFALICAGGVIRVWDIEQGRGQHLYNFNENIGEVNAMMADDRHVAAASSDTTIHLWNFGAQLG